MSKQARALVRSDSRVRRDLVALVAKRYFDGAIVAARSDPFAPTLAAGRLLFNGTSPSRPRFPQTAPRVFRTIPRRAARDAPSVALAAGSF
jgi:hypothetical protein